jgi:hypothetical protein
MSFWRNFFDGEKEIKERQEKVTKVMHRKKTQFERTMNEIQRQSHKLKKQNEKAFLESQRLASLVDSVTKDIAIATGGIKNE